ncbi:cAMP-binding domain of CRP or a regulatory subunit of cAMP-dependent protein kinases [Carnobacterium alterfunditum]|uniref:cAMP-binding domain of CRP or a regulatory subunit of cAMP-dependent protein kinases n=1 Tax=Carnobacterium alterfunditum TaxID=28230 RepID=A0A1N6I366_9LACT|nr:Crp/Fnr family transcriptional regulator [Carnobacterium alterfunditum]SIO26365.1 cAMP-binding domain of CRP or a regulatory subunit of cAMP-dependent protein kinases [Carnobacterium alterfunditum]
MTTIQKKMTNLYELRYSPIFSEFTDPEFNLIRKNMCLRKYKKGQVLFDEGDVREKIFYLVNGLVRLEKYDESAFYTYTDYVKKETLFPYGGMFSDEMYHYSASAVTDIELYYIPTALFESLVAEKPKQIIYFYHKLSKILESHEKRVQYMVVSNASNRIIKTLNYLMQELGDYTNPTMVKIEYPITINEIANMSGCSRETVGNTIKKLKEMDKLAYDHKFFLFKDLIYFNSYTE